MGAEKADEFYRSAMQGLQEANVPFLVGGACALCAYTGITRDTKDFDLFVRPGDVKRAAECLRGLGLQTEMTFPHWLAKVKSGENCIDLIYRAGNGLCEVDDSWFERARLENVLGLPVHLTPPEEMLWMKCYIMERERFDGADVAHLLQSCAAHLDWPHLVRRFGADWRVLLSHLVLFGFIYPAERERIPASILSDLLQRTQEETSAAPPAEPVCRGTLLSRAQYLTDVEERGYLDARRWSEAKMSAEDVASWTAAIDKTE